MSCAYRACAPLPRLRRHEWGKPCDGHILLFRKGALPQTSDADTTFVDGYEVPGGSAEAEDGTDTGFVDGYEVPGGSAEAEGGGVAPPPAARRARRYYRAPAEREFTVVVDVYRTAAQRYAVPVVADSAADARAQVAAWDAAKVRSSGVAQVQGDRESDAVTESLGGIVAVYPADANAAQL